jgi:hypothetical protein
MFLPEPWKVENRDFAHFLDSDVGKQFFSGAWGWFAVVVVLAIFNTVLGEELLFRGFLLPRMNGAFGRVDWLANGVLFSAYHLHERGSSSRRWPMPSSLRTRPSGTGARGSGSPSTVLRAW